MNQTKDTKVALISLYDTGALGVRYISSTLKERGFNVSIIFFKKMTIRDTEIQFPLRPLPSYSEPPTSEEKHILIELLKRINPDIVGISLRSAFFDLAIDLTKSIKEHLNTLIIWGGIHPTLLPEKCIKYTDLVCVGEGEGPMLDLVTHLEGSRDISDIPSLWIKTEKGVIKNDVRPLVRDLDQIPFPDIEFKDKYYIYSKLSTQVKSYHLRDEEEAGLSIIPGIIVYDIMTSRGCPFSCTYCSNCILRKEIYRGEGPYYRRRSVENVMAELEYAKSKNPNMSFVFFWDDVLTLDKEWVKKFSRKYKERIGLMFLCYGHPNCIDKEIAKCLKETGLNTLWMGIQSGSEKVRKEVLGRDTPTEEIIKAANTLHDTGVEVTYDLITDIPYENESDHYETLKLLLSLPQPTLLNMYSLANLPATPLTKRMLNDGLITEDDIEGATKKTIVEWTTSTDYPRDKLDLFWNTLYGLTQFEVLSRDSLLKIGKSRFWKKYPRFLLKYIKLLCYLKRKPPFYSRNR